MMAASKLSPIEDRTRTPSTSKTTLGSLFVAEWLGVSSLVRHPTDDRIGVGKLLLNRRVVGEDGSVSGKHTTVRYYPTTTCETMINST